ncbi:MAG TPA: hypothetical protein EYO96_00085 [Candidatus Marinimicrobia bacterium]|nr:hypothetical protein [Candidatus Neomarinimicrobiota bacterium]
MKVGDLVRYKLEYDIDALTAGIVVDIYEPEESSLRIRTMIGILWNSSIWEDEARYFEVVSESR